SVLLLEAGKQFGGYTNPFARRHFHFDPGIHYIGEAGPGGAFRHLLDKLGLDHVAFSELDPDGFDHYVFPGYDVKNCVGLERFRDRLAADVPAERDALHRFFRLLADVDRVLREAPRVRDAAGLWRVLRRTPGLLRWSRATLAELLDHYFTDPRVKAALAGPCGDLGLPPGRLSAIMHMGLLTHYSRGAYFPHGGSGALRDAFVDGLKEEGAVLKRNARVERILHEGGRVTGVQLADGSVHRGRTIISNAQAGATYEMVGLEHLRPRLRKKLAATEHSYASLILFMGVDGELDTSAVGSSNVWAYDTLDIDQAFGEAAMEDWRECSSYFLTVPTNKDPDGGLAPEGMQTVELVTLCAGEPFQKWFGTKTKRRGAEYEALKEEIAEHYLGLAERHLPGLRDHLVFREVATPATNVSYTLSAMGNIYGPAHGPGQIPPFRFAPRAPVDGLYLCGASVMSCGIVPCASSGRDAGKMALKELEGRSARGVVGVATRLARRLSPPVRGERKPAPIEDATAKKPSPRAHA
ncbi:MAG: hypothetical protein CMH59_02790, partial [Myxococcales bacterium]|nr:hypothetical protein [Myxococcales bacterium]